MNDEHLHDFELHALAGEYVLGTLIGEERRQLEQRLVFDKPLQAAVAEWEARLHPLTELVTPQTPSPQLWPRVGRSLDALTQTQVVAEPARWWQQLGLWRGLTAASLAMSLLLAAVVVYRPLPEPSYIVVLVGPEDRDPGWLVQASDLNEVQLIPLASVEVPADQVLEFWTKGEDWSRPVSLGLVEPGKRLRIGLDTLPPLAPNQLFELTLEQAGGSSTGLPTGPIQFIGRAVKI
ncbi:anti-sigma factor [Oceanisphaera ostreae]|uniref:Regulator of SigK n=1 Tax=Oceanisphaera ostreae TaxID=914151 RepID=A0ABW3KND5_9GAMM